jgi:3-deoxy-manno-octulosonate cytidylyltransferase (CMP-KDO synthetase)
LSSAIIIPARLDSNRLEKKLLQDIHAKPLIQWVYERAIKVPNITRVVIAVDHQNLYEVCMAFGADVVMTSPTHKSGTDRIGEVAQGLTDIEYIINLQGDEPLIDPQEISHMMDFMHKRGDAIMTMYEIINDENHLFDYNVVKLVKTTDDKAIYFSRQAIPAQRDLPFKDWMKNHIYYRHRGIYAYRRDTLLELTKLRISELEKAESLEQLRWIEAGYTIGVFPSNSFSIGVDTQADLDKIKHILTPLNR